MNAPLSPSDLLTTSNKVEFAYESIEQAFPPVVSGVEPCGANGLFLIKHPMRKTKGGLWLPPESRSTEHYNTQVAKCLALGPLAFMTVDDATGELREWKGGRWFDVGDFVRLPKYGGDRFTVPFEYSETHDGEKVTHKEHVVVAIFKVKDVIAKITGDPLSINAYLD